MKKDELYVHFICSKCGPDDNYHIFNLAVMPKYFHNRSEEYKKWVMFCNHGRAENEELFKRDVIICRLMDFNMVKID